MGKRGNRLNALSLLIIGAFIILGSRSVWASATHQPIESDGDGVDLIMLDISQQFGPLERPPVAFHHDRHTIALAKQSKDCLACHPEKDGKLVLTFKGSADLDKQAAMDLYHDNCIACHNEVARSGAQSGPVTCGECHSDNMPPASHRQSMQMDKYLHYEHTHALSDQCDLCHHQYNKETKTLVYVKGQEEACVYCHKAQSEENRISYSQAAHTQCIGCHRQRTARKEQAGPIQCIGCHGPESLSGVEKIADLPRIKRNQPDAVLVKRRFSTPAAETPESGMGPVAFDHRSHEAYTDSCRVCHHADLGICARCHTATGNQEGDGIKLEQAMHTPTAKASCIGCHRIEQRRKDCIGCHHAIRPVDDGPDATASCAICHASRLGVGAPPVPASAMDDQTAREVAQRLLAERPREMKTIPEDQIPETVTIKHLADQYEAVIMPHRQMVLALAGRIKDNPLVVNFHSDATTLCQGCHHRAPGSTQPSECISCHGQATEDLNPDRPGLLAAYHQQCIDCHEYMGIEKPASRQCTACHAQRTSKKTDP